MTHQNRLNTKSARNQKHPRHSWLVRAPKTGSKQLQTRKKIGRRAQALTAPSRLALSLCVCCSRLRLVGWNQVVSATEEDNCAWECSYSCHQNGHLLHGMFSFLYNSSVHSNHRNHTPAATAAVAGGSLACFFFIHFFFIHEVSRFANDDGEQGDARPLKSGESVTTTREKFRPPNPRRRFVVRISVSLVSQLWLWIGDLMCFGIFLIPKTRRRRGWKMI